MTEAVLLTGGSSRRMGEDKAGLRIGGEALAARIVRLLREAGIPGTVLGLVPIDGADFQADPEPHAGPLAALAGFRPTREFVFVCSCDLPGFDPALVARLEQSIGARDAAIPTREGRPQPLCALYRASALAAASRLHGGGEKRIMKWIEQIDAIEVDGIDPRWTQNVNTPDDLVEFLASG